MNRKDFLTPSAQVMRLECQDVILVSPETTAYWEETVDYSIEITGNGGKDWD